MASDHVEESGEAIVEEKVEVLVAEVLLYRA
jgi:hypothetical protein